MPNILSLKNQLSVISNTAYSYCLASFSPAESLGVNIHNNLHIRNQKQLLKFVFSINSSYCLYNQFVLMKS